MLPDLLILTTFITSEKFECITVVNPQKNLKKRLAAGSNKKTFNCIILEDLASKGNCLFVQSTVKFGIVEKFWRR